MGARSQGNVINCVGVYSSARGVGSTLGMLEIRLCAC